MYINYDFQVKLATNSMLKKLTNKDFEDFYSKSILSRLETPKILVAVWIKSKKNEILKNKTTSIIFLDDSDSLNPIVYLTLFDCKDFEAKIGEVDSYLEYQSILKDISIEWQDFLIEKLGVDYKLMLAEYERKRIENITNKNNFKKETDRFNLRFADVLDKLNTND